MADAIEYIYIDGEAIPKPPEMTIGREDVYAGEYTTCTGAVIADRIGWKYSDLTLKWDALQQSYIEILTGMSGEHTLQFDDPDGDEIEEPIMRSSAVYLRHRRTMRGEVWWRNVEVTVRFIDVHND